jgi:hypothetical protein
MSFKSFPRNQSLTTQVFNRLALLRCARTAPRTRRTMAKTTATAGRRVFSGPVSVTPREDRCRVVADLGRRIKVFRLG